MGRPQRMGERSPLAMRRMSGWRSSYVTMGMRRLKPAGSAPFKPWRCKYSAQEFCLRISKRTRLWTSSAFMVTSSMNLRAFRCSSGLASCFGASGMVDKCKWPLRKERKSNIEQINKACACACACACAVGRQW
ncbi:hypothetical protein DsansV1_C03g0035531 [Dioscorea sansibarensis]